MAHGQFSHEPKMHEAFPRTSFRIAVFQVPASCLERRFPSATGIVAVQSSGVIAGCSGIFLAFCVLLVANHRYNYRDGFE